MAIDRRVRKSKKAIDDAFYELLATYSIDDISVTMITTKADIVRKTFYAHYLDKKDYIDAIVDNHLLTLKKICDGIEERSIYQITLVWLLFFNENQLFFNRLLESKTNVGQQFLIDFIQKELEYKYTKLYWNNSLEFMFLFTSHGILGIIKEFLSDKKNPETTAKELSILIKNIFDMKTDSN